MFSSLDFALFSLLNDYLRNTYFDFILPFFSFSWPLWLGVIAFLFFFSLYCLKHHGDALYRVIALFITFAVTYLVSESGSMLLKGVFERDRPYEQLSATLYYDESAFQWYDIVHEITKKDGGLTYDTIVATQEMSTINDESHDKISEEKSQSLEETSDTKTLATPTDETLTSDEHSTEQILQESEEFVVTPLEEHVASENQDATTIPATPASVDSAENTNGQKKLGRASDYIADLEENIGLQKDLSSYPTISYKQAFDAGVFTEEAFSMPSSFAANVMALTIIIALLFPKCTPWIYLIPLVTGWARVYTGNSFPMDVVVGWIWGVFAVAIAWFICEFLFRFASKSRKL